MGGGDDPPPSPQMDYISSPPPVPTESPSLSPARSEEEGERDPIYSIPPPLSFHLCPSSPRRLFVAGCAVGLLATTTTPQATETSGRRWTESSLDCARRRRNHGCNHSRNRRSCRHRIGCRSCRHRIGRRRHRSPRVCNCNRMRRTGEERREKERVPGGSGRGRNPPLTRRWVGEGRVGE